MKIRLTINNKSIRKILGDSAIGKTVAEIAASDEVQKAVKNIKSGIKKATKATSKVATSTAKKINSNPSVKKAKAKAKNKWNSIISSMYILDK